MVDGFDGLFQPRFGLLVVIEPLVGHGQKQMAIGDGGVYVDAGRGSSLFVLIGGLGVSECFGRLFVAAGAIQGRPQRR